MKKIDKPPKSLFISFINLWLPVFLYAYSIFFISSVPQLALPISFAFSDKLLHLGEYMIFGWLIARALKLSFRGLFMAKLCLLVTIITAIYGVTDEYHQSFVPGRICSGWDTFFDAVGGLLGSLFYR